MASSDDSSPKEPTVAEITKAYEDGKDRRYKLLFAVNGGDFTVVKWLAGERNAPTFLGSLELWQIGVGMALFTLAMVADIDAFGLKMRKNGKQKGEKLYARMGVIVLLSIGSLIVAGWVLVAVPHDWKPWDLLLATLAIAAHCLLVLVVLRRLGDATGEAP